MKRVLTATCFAMACAVGLAAQQTTGTTGTADDQGGQGRGAGPRTVTGCLRAGDTAGTYMLTDIQMSNRAGTTGTTTGGGTTTTAPPPPPPVTTTGDAGQRGMMPTSVMLATTDASVDLKPHVGHKIEVTGTMAGGGRRGGDTTGAGTTTTGGGTTTTGGGTTGESAQARPAMRTMNVTSIRMISETCSNQ